MSTEDTEFEGGEDVPMTDEQYNTAMEELLNENSMQEVGQMISGVLEFLTAKALHDGPYYIETDNKEAITVFAANEDAIALKEVLPDNVTSWEDEVKSMSVITDRDTGDEQDGDAK
jgi:hypothetical protein